VFTEEPIPVHHPLLKVKERDKILITPHHAWASKESRSRLIEGVARNIEQFKRDNHMH
jgi:glycerate dehydrogenase